MVYSDFYTLSGTILIAEDEPSQLELLRLILKAEYKNIDIITVTTGLEALAQARAVLPDLVVSDLYIPEMNGINLCKALKKDSKTKHIPFLLITAHANEKTQVASLQAGAEDFLEKPLNAADILHRVGKAISGSRALVSHKQSTSYHDTTSLDNSIASAKETHDAIRNRMISIHDSSVRLLESETIWKLGSGEIDLIRNMKQDCCELLDLLSTY